MTPRHDQCVTCGGALSLDPFDPSGEGRVCPRCDGGGERSEPLDPVCACGLRHGHAGLCADDPNEYNRALLNDGEERRDLPEDDWRDER